jgi:hypothetical protein
MHKSFGLIALLLFLPGSAPAAPLVAIDCTSADATKSKVVFSYLFDTDNALVQVTTNYPNPILNGGERRILGASISDTTLVIHVLRPNDTSYFDIPISRLTGEARYHIPAPGNSDWQLTCSPSKPAATFTMPILAFDDTGALSVVCRRLTLPSTKDSNPPQTGEFDLKYTFYKATREVTRKPINADSEAKSEPTGPLTIVSSDHLAFEGTGGMFVLNLMTGNLAGYKPDMSATGNVLECREDRAGGAQRKF